jgi:ABC transport permease subunit
MKAEVSPLPGPGPGPGPAEMHDRASSGTRASLISAGGTLVFFGEVLLALGRLLRGRSAMRWGDFWLQVDQTGPQSIPVVALTCFLIGLMLAYMGGSMLDKLGAQSYIADIVTVGMVRELAGLMTGMILAGRVGAAFGAQLATMKAGEEIDALRVLGVDPIDHLVLPRLLALLLVAPLLMAHGCAGGRAGRAAAGHRLAYGVPAAEYLHQCLRALTWTHLWIGLFKACSTPPWWRWPAAAKACTPAATPRPWARPPPRRWSRGWCGSSPPPASPPCASNLGFLKHEDAAATPPAGPAADPRAPLAKPARPVAHRAGAMASPCRTAAGWCSSDWTFDVRRGEVLVIVGASGCGKSTLLRHLIGLEPPAGWAC